MLLPQPAAVETAPLPIIPGHQIVGVDEKSGQRVGVP